VAIVLGLAVTSFKMLLGFLVGVLVAVVGIYCALYYLLNIAEAAVAEDKQNEVSKKLDQPNFEGKVRHVNVPVQFPRFSSPFPHLCLLIRLLQYPIMYTNTVLLNLQPKCVIGGHWKRIGRFHPSARSSLSSSDFYLVLGRFEAKCDLLSGSSWTI